MSTTSQLTDLTESLKRCSKCAAAKPVSQFSRRSGYGDGRNAWCKACHSSYMAVYEESYERRRPTSAEVRAANYRKIHGITVGQYEVLLASQNGKCAICKTTKPGKNVTNFMVDHCHNTSRIRGLLCRSCNMALGMMKDSTTILRDAADYLERTAG